MLVSTRCARPGADESGQQEDDMIDEKVCKHSGCGARAMWRVTFSMYNGSQASLGAKVQTWCKVHAIEEADRLNEARRSV